MRTILFMLMVVSPLAALAKVSAVEPENNFHRRWADLFPMSPVLTRLSPWISGVVG